MALANAACLLAERAGASKPILMIDWDLEAPGLHRFFQGRLWRRTSGNRYAQTRIDEHPGLIDLFRKIDAAVPPEQALDLNAAEDHAAETLGGIDLDEYILNTDVRSLQLIKAGTFDAGYATRVNTFGWASLHDRSPFLFSRFAQILTARFSYVLIDSRTGLTDTSGICTSLMPERLVVVFTPNRQSLAGVTELVRQSLDYRRHAEDERPLLVYPLPSRIESNREDLRRDWRHGNPARQIDGYQPQFEALFKDMYGLQECSLEHYFNDVQIQQSQDYAYGEEIAALLEKQEDRFSLKRSYKTFLDWVETGAKPWERTEPETVPVAEVREIESKVAAAEESAQRLRSRLKVALAAVFVLIVIGSVVLFKASESPESNIDHWVESVAISSDGSYVAACRYDRQMRIWRTGNAQEGAVTLPGDPRCSQIFFAADTHSVVLVESTGVSVWNLDAPAEAPRIYPIESQTSALSRDGTRLAVAASTGISLFDLSTGALVGSAALADSPPIYALAVSADGQRMAVMTNTGMLVWDAGADPEQAMRRLNNAESTLLERLDISPDGKLLASCTSHVATLWNLEKFGAAPVTAPDVHCYYAVAFSPDGKFLAVDRVNKLELLPLTASGFGPPMSWAEDSQPQHKDSIAAISISADGSQVVSAGRDGVVLLSSTTSQWPPRALTFP